MRRYRTVSQRHNDLLAAISWQDFERLIGAYYAGQGYRVEHVGTAGSGGWFDGGIDLKLYRDDQYLVVQCKHWNTQQLTHNPVHELLGVMLTEHATGAIVVTSGEFTKAAHEAATKEPRIQLIDGVALRRMLGPSFTAPAPIPENPVMAKPPGHANGSRPPRPRGRPRRSSARNPLPGIALSIIAALLVMLAIRHVLTDTARKLGPAPAALTAPTPASQSPRSRAASTAHPALPAPGHMQGVPQTDEELQEWKRRNAESMKILEKTTPEMPLR